MQIAIKSKLFALVVDLSEKTNYLSNSRYIFRHERLSQSEIFQESW